MANQIVITIPEDQTQLVAESFARHFGFVPMADPQPPVETTEADADAPEVLPEVPELTADEILDKQVTFARERIVAYVVDVVKQHLEWQQRQSMPDVPDNPLNLT